MSKNNIIMDHEYYCISCLHKMISLLFIFIIGIILLYFSIFKANIQMMSKRKSTFKTRKSMSTRSVSSRYHSRSESAQRGKELSPSIVAFSLLAIIFYCISLTSLLIGDITIDSIYWSGTPYAITSITWATANSFVYLTFMKRMRNVFKNTAYRSPKSTYIMLCILIFIYFNCEVTFFILEIDDEISKHGLSDDFKFRIETFVAVIEVFADVSISFFLTTLFCKKLMAVALATFDRDDLYDQFRDSLQSKSRQSLSAEIKVSSTQKNLLNIVTKQTVLAAIGTMTTQIWLLYYVPLVMIWSYGKDNTHNLLYLLHIISEAVVVTDMCINTLCVLLAFAYFKNYYKSLCGYCHQCCLKRCIHITQKKIATELSENQYQLELNSYHRLEDHL